MWVFTKEERSFWDHFAENKSHGLVEIYLNQQKYYLFLLNDWSGQDSLENGVAWPQLNILGHTFVDLVGSEAVG